MKKIEVIKKIQDISTPLSKLASDYGGIIEDFVRCKDNNSLIKPNETIISYGANVRLSNETAGNLFPFAYSNIKGFNSHDVGANAEDNYRIPPFLAKYCIQDAFLKVKFEEKEDSVLLSNISCLSSSNNPFSENNTKINGRTIRRFFISKPRPNIDNNKTFLLANIEKMIECLKKDEKKLSSPVYVWIRGEDINTKTDPYLINILAISDNKEFLENFKEDHLSDIISFVMLLKSRRLMDFDLEKKRESIKSAVSAIMSRNMSHNLGSHFLYYTKAYLEKKASEIDTSLAADIRGTAKVLGYIQARMDYLATIISNDRYPYGCVNLKSQIYDELTVDDFSHRHFQVNPEKRTTNFLLRNLILSENFSRANVCEDRKQPIFDEGVSSVSIHIKISNDLGGFATFTGTSMSKYDFEGLDISMEDELDVKNRLSSLNIALPGGIMSCHALFNVIENFIRNSAKYRRDDTPEEGLVITIAIRPHQEKKNQKKNQNLSLETAKFVDIIIYDNKGNAKAMVPCEKTHDEVKNQSNHQNKETYPKEWSLYDSILDKLGSIMIVKDDNTISKENKGFKEMLFSSIWMKLFAYQDKTFADVVTLINQAPKDEKIEKIEEYGFSLVYVEEKEMEDVEKKQKGIKDKHIYSISTFSKGSHEIPDNSNLGIMLKLPLYKTFQRFESSQNSEETILSMLNMMADVVVVDKGLKKKFKRAFTRTLTGLSGVPLEDDYAKFEEAVKHRFPDIDQYALCFTDQNTDRNVVKEAEYNKISDERKIYFKRHLMTQMDSCDISKYAYADTISGGDFTVTLLDLIREAINEKGEYTSNKNRIFGLKIKESALTRITIIDERLYKSSIGKEGWLSLKNIRVLNYDEQKDKDKNISEFIDLFTGNSFRDNKNETHFLSIHLGLIEKILKNSIWVKENFKEKDEDNNPANDLSLKRVEKFMEKLKESFKHDKGLYIAIHSGRGNFSAELEDPLAEYPFINLSALENVFNNSKYLLAQLFYNTVYIGKGKANKKDK